MSSKANWKAGDVEIKRIDMMSIDGNKKVSLLLQAVVMNIYESILKPTIVADIFIRDGIGLWSSFPIIGEETIEIEFSTPGFDKTTTYKLHNYSPQNATTDSSNTTREYVLKCCSPELLDDATSLVFKKYKDQCSNIVQTILTDNLKTDKDINIEETKGIQELLISSMNPLRAVDYVRQRSVSNKYKSSSFVFFENQHGYNFATIEFLFDKNKKNIGDKTFFYDADLNSNLESIDFRNIISYNHVGKADTINKLKNGAIYNNTKYFDILTGDYKDTEFSATGKQFEYPDDNASGLNSSTFNNRFDKKRKHVQFIPVDSSKPDTFLPSSRGPLQAFAQQLVQNMVHIHTYGDSVLSVGDVIKVTMPEINGMSGPEKKDQMIAGNYMVAKLRHIFVNSSRWNYTNSMELISGTFFDNP